MSATQGNLGKAIVFGVAAGLGALLGDLVQEPFADLSGPEETPIAVILGSALWFGIIGASITAAIIAAQQHYLLRRVKIDRPLLLACGFGFGAGALSGGIAQFIYSAGGAGEPLRAACWALAGGLLGFGLSYRIPNLGHLRGTMGGLAGGLLGGILFIAVAFGFRDDLPARVVGTFAIGFMIGLMIVLAEALFREAWLRIDYGPRETRTVSLGPEPISLGSDASACTVYIAGIAAKACSFRLERGQIILEDHAQQSRSTVAPGATWTFGRATVSVHGAAGGAAGGTFGVSDDPSAASPATSGAQTNAQPALSLCVGRGSPIPLRLGTTVRVGDIPALGGSSAPDAGRELAIVSSNPSDPSMLGLRNLSATPWQVLLPDSRRVNIATGQSVRLQRGARINIGEVEGEIR
jgi:hypothetical protein